MLKSAVHIVVATGVDGVVTFLNDAFEKALGYSAEQVVGLETPALWHDKMEVGKRAKALSEELGQVVEPGFDVFTVKPRRDGSEVSQWTFIRKDQSRFPVELTVTCMRDSSDEIVGYLGMIQNLTKSQQREEILRDRNTETRSFLDLIISNLPDLVFAKDDAFRIVEANPAFLNLYPPEARDKVIGYTTLESYSKEESDLFLKNDRIAFETGKSETTESIQFPDGSKRLLETKKIRFENSAGKKFILGIGHDVTQREELIEQLKEINKELEEFGYRTSHDLRAPLVSVRGLAHCIEEDLDEGDLEEARANARRIAERVETLETLTGDILKLAKADFQVLKKEKVELSSVLADVTSRLPEIDRGVSNVEVTAVSSHTGAVLVSRTRMSQILENLISNGVRYSDPQKAQRFVKVTSFDQGEDVRVEVEDNGLGVPQEFQHELFTQFKRFHSEVSAGSGLGLFLVKKHLEKMNGSIEYRKTKQGSLFVMVFPKDV